MVEGAGDLGGDGGALEGAVVDAAHDVNLFGVDDGGAVGVFVVAEE